MTSRGPVTVRVVVFVIAAVLAATLYPLLTYTASLACFGLAHVLVELRYVDGRFGARLPGALWWCSGLVVAGVVILRGLRLGGVVVPSATGLELALVTVLLVVGVFLARRLSLAAMLGSVAAVAVGVGAIVAPLETLLTLALIHNLTPLGFVVERAPAARRPYTALVATCVFVGVPLLVASGLPTALAGALVDVDRAFFSAGDLSRHLGVYLWPSWQADDAAVARFSGAVCAQLLHYGAVLLWLPRQLGDDDAPVLRWPSWPTLTAMVAVLGGGLAVHFAVDFAGARAAYGLPAAVHAWLELPVLVVALSGLNATTAPSPGPSRS